MSLIVLFAASLIAGGDFENGGGRTAVQNVWLDCLELKREEAK